MILEVNRDGYPLRNWWDIAKALERQSFQVLRTNCSGTAFLVSQGIEKDSLHRHYCFATAWHVIDNAIKDDRFVLYTALMMSWQSTLTLKG